MLKQIAISFITWALLGFVTVLPAQVTPLETLQNQAGQLLPHVESPFATQFLKAAEGLPELTEPRVVYYNKETRAAFSEEEAAERSEAELEGYQRVELGEQFYYNTMYGTPLAAVRALDLAGMAGFPGDKPEKVLDFGFGSVGQLRLMAATGCEVTGVEVSSLLKAFYNSADTGSVPNIHPNESPGSIKLLYGRFPAEDDIVSAVGEGYNLVISKNTLKKGYVNPEQEIDPRRGVDLGVSDELFLKEMHRILKAGGLFMIYNLSPAREAEGEPYNPQADGRSPFPEAMLEKAGFEIIAFNRDDTSFAHRMAGVFGWDRQMNPETDLRGMYTLVRKK